jgi:hypothetical protein
MKNVKEAVHTPRGDVFDAAHKLMLRYWQHSLARMINRHIHLVALEWKFGSNLDYLRDSYSRLQRD